MTEGNEEVFKKKIVIVDFVKKSSESDKIRHHCLFTGKYRGPAHIKLKNNVTQDQSKFIPVIFENFSYYECHLFFPNIS